MKPREVKINNRIDTLDPELKEVLAGEMLGVCISALTQYGISSGRLAELCNRAIARPGETPTASRLIKEAEQLAKLASAWMGSVEYVDDAGRPKVLPIRGSAPSFACLAKKFFGRRTLEEVMELGVKTQVLERVGDDKVAQFGGCVIFAGNPSLMLVHAIQSIRGFLATTLVNATSNGSWATRLPDRKASATIAAENVDRFVDVMRESIINVIEMGNRWLMAHEDKITKASNSNAIKVGIHAYVFCERHPSVR
jgi:hypothetical protein